MITNGDDNDDSVSSKVHPQAVKTDDEGNESEEEEEEAHTSILSKINSGAAKNWNFKMETISRDLGVVNKTSHQINLALMHLTKKLDCQAKICQSINVEEKKARK
jgi:hypothetical protein